MPAVMYSGPRTLVVNDRPPVTPGPGQVEIGVSYVGICGTDLHIFHGDMDARVSPPAVIGHEMSGRILAVGEGVAGWSVGDGITVMPLVSCGTCAACRAGHAHVCQLLTFIGIDSPGAMQSRWTVPSDILVRLPEGVSLRDAALVEPTAVAVHDVGRARLRPGERVLVVGGGPVGLLIALVAMLENADVVVVEPDSFRRGLAQELGVATLDPATGDVTAFVEDWTSGAGADVAFEVSGAAGGVDTAVDALAARGRLVLVAIHTKRREVNLHRFFWRELNLLGARLYDRADFERAVELVAAGQIPVAALISRIEPVNQAAEAFAALEGGGVMKVLIDCTGESS